MWHALEEIEHKAVAYDVYQEVFGDNTVRRLAMVAATLSMVKISFTQQLQLLQHDGLSRKPSVWLKGLWKLWGESGLARKGIPHWLAYMRRDFHPWQLDDSHLVREFEPIYAASQAV